MAWGVLGKPFNIRGKRRGAGGEPAIVTANMPPPSTQGCTQQQVHSLVSSISHVAAVSSLSVAFVATSNIAMTAT